MDYYNDYYHTEDDIVELENKIKPLLNMPLLDDENEMFMVTDYDIEGVDMSEFNWFKKRKVVRMFFIKSITIKNSKDEFIHENDFICSITGIQKLWDYRLNFSKLEKNLVKFTLNNKISMIFGMPEILN